ncbi:hypothetical protein EL78_3302 [Escherichia coli]|nr:hypothetical protein EL78_3302 [Escherichia coli]
MLVPLQCNTGLRKVASRFYKRRSSGHYYLPATR